jgi:hypothetical protein
MKSMARIGVAAAILLLICNGNNCGIAATSDSNTFQNNRIENNKGNGMHLVIYSRA